MGGVGGLEGCQLSDRDRFHLVEQEEHPLNRVNLVFDSGQMVSGESQRFGISDDLRQNRSEPVAVACLEADHAGVDLPPQLLDLRPGLRDRIAHLGHAGRGGVESLLHLGGAASQVLHSLAHLFHGVGELQVRWGTGVGW